MKLAKVAVAAIAVIAILVLAAFAGMGLVIFDVMSYTATGSQMLSPAGGMAGKALVVYDPGISGQAKDAAAKIAGDLQAKGYTVDLCGIRSADAGKTGGYDTIVVGGPVYMANASSSVKSYLEKLTPGNGTKLGVFGTGGSKLESDDPAIVRQDVASVDTPYTIKAVTKLTPQDDVDKKCTGFVDELLR